ncbi:hypothetical protein C6W88_14320 [Halomonas litopenaei]|uniref:Uncharacterized protein n=1 Tax=Halomonas litopenaei TaxID=2109328 RepID=A0ABX5IVL7_9GAMM|nr:hypothetical protein C6W89_10295 [Halomonas sp. SYSU XM8]PTL94110.1 hypothetical protein C6W88_14320 [Halomonas litopenaei]
MTITKSLLIKEPIIFAIYILRLPFRDLNVLSKFSIFSNQAFEFRFQYLFKRAYKFQLLPTVSVLMFNFIERPKH